MEDRDDPILFVPMGNELILFCLYGCRGFTLRIFDVAFTSLIILTP